MSRCATRARGGLLGNLYVAPDGPSAWRTWQIGYVFDPRRWGNGYATEACRALVEDLVTVRRAHRVVARCDPRNGASWALLERLGMRREGMFREAASFEVDAAGDQVWHDAFLYALLASEWRAAAVSEERARSGGQARAVPALLE